jgi:hypothetical protein
MEAYGSCSFKKLTISEFKGVKSRYIWRGAGAAELARLESVCTPKGYRGFESLSLRAKPVERPQKRYFVPDCILPMLQIH